MLVAVVVVVVVAERWLCGRRELNQPACLPAYSLAHSLTHALTARLAPLRCTPSSRASERRRVRASNARRQSSCEVPSTHKTNACAHDEQREEDERYAPRSRSLSSVACGAVRGGQQQRRRAARRGATRAREREGDEEFEAAAAARAPPPAPPLLEDGREQRELPRALNRPSLPSCRSPSLSLHAAIPSLTSSSCSSSAKAKAKANIEPPLSSSHINREEAPPVML